jgi:LuxR family transcriptional regulator, maltose regulon positive regulatory protein
MSGALCDAVCGTTGSQAMLAQLEKRNLFVVALDSGREWYRYHHLFAEVLQAHAVREDAARIGDLHRRASTWHEAHGSHRHTYAAWSPGRARTSVSGSDFTRVSQRPAR